MRYPHILPYVPNTSGVRNSAIPALGAKHRLTLGPRSVREKVSSGRFESALRTRRKASRVGNVGSDEEEEEEEGPSVSRSVPILARTSAPERARDDNPPPLPGFPVRAGAPEVE